MYLKSIEIQGFKSFANKIRLEFSDGFTAIVGPNGSGKSNVADAVRWVLGEQRVKQLRGGSMQDVIFAGTELRKPLSSAYVAITLDNSDHKLPVDYDEVTIARRLFRSGESEYILNGVQVRLRDVQELFYDTGIGKEGYSIIGQGQIEKILSDKPEDRRELFDEAAGIVKFKTRKNASLKKLENEKANLIRVNDILSELEKQVGPLEEQSKKAQIYLQTREELKKQDINVFLIENGKTTAALNKVTEHLSLAESDLEKAGKDYEASKVRSEELRVELEQLEISIEEIRNSINKANIIRSQLEGNIKVYEEQIRSAQRNADHFGERKTAVSAQLVDKNEEKDGILSGKSGIDSRVNELKGKRDEAAKLLSDTADTIDALTNDLDEKRNAVLKLLNDRAGVKARQAALKTQKEQYEVRKSELSARLISASSNEAEHDRTLGKLREDFEKICGEVCSINDTIKENDNKIAELKKRLVSNDDALRSAEIEYHQDKSKLDQLINLTERYEGFGGSVKHVMEQKKNEKGLVGVVADLIKTEPRYETAIETALGGSIQNIVTVDEDTAKRMITMLKRDKAGRATFLPLSALKNAQPFNMTGVLAEPGIIGLADTLVRTAPEYRDVARSLLGRIVVADNFDHAAAAQRKFSHKLRMVTLDGELFTPGGSISGGAFKSSSNLLGRRREIEGLNKSIRDIALHIDELNASIVSTKKERDALRIEQENLRKLQQAKFLEQNTARMSINREEEKKQEAAMGYDSLKNENENIEELRASLITQEAEIEKLLEASGKDEINLNKDIDSMNAELSRMREQEEEQSAVVSKWEVEVSKVRQSQEFKDQELARIDSEIERLQSELSQIEKDLADAAKEIDDRHKQIEETRKTIESSGTAKSDAEKSYSDSLEKKEKLSDQSVKLQREREALFEQKNELDKEVYRLSGDKTKMEEAIEAQINYMWAEYEITLSKAAELRDEALTESDLPSLKKSIASLKSRIRGLGDVNVNAIEQYKEVSERYVFMKQQRDDIAAAQKNLENIIQELDAAMRKQFKEQFAKIQKEFDKVFKELFGGGEGRLELLDSEDILEAGVLVIAQPPGKKLQNMMQMSGGEKSLTAISLLFAIQNLKPSPFCLLDEIEAALDESNVGRFAGYIHKLTKNTQFIVITHRRGTMDRADRLFGITMQEKGVSTMVSVNLLDDKDLSE